MNTWRRSSKGGSCGPAVCAYFKLVAAHVSAVLVSYTCILTVSTLGEQNRQGTHPMASTKLYPAASEPLRDYILSIMCQVRRRTMQTSKPGQPQVVTLLATRATLFGCQVRTVAK